MGTAKALEQAALAVLLEDAFGTAPLTAADRLSETIGDIPAVSEASSSA